MQRVAIETPTPISAMVCKEGISNVMDKASYPQGAKKVPL